MNGDRPPPPVSGIVLAAGTSSRLASGVTPEGGQRNLPKQLLELGGRPLLRRVAQAALGSRLSEVVVVLGHEARQVAAALDGLEVRTVVNPDYRRGQSASVRAGLAAAAPDARAALFLPADQPLVSSRLIDRLIAAWAGCEGAIAVPVRHGDRGAPVLFDRAYFAELAALEGDAGGRRLLPRHPAAIVEVEVDDPLELADVDTEEDLRLLEEQVSGSG